VLTLAISAALAAATPALAGDATVVGTATATTPSSRWIAVEAPLAGDDNRNGWTTYGLAASTAGPFSGAAAFQNDLPGASEWRADVLGRGHVAPGGTYFVQVTWFDPDGVVGDLLDFTWSGPFGSAAGATPTVTAAGAAVVVPHDRGKKKP
jgi:hypothetical protein